ncbi:membrane protein [Aureimonas ureilytica]|uniref:Membrane protein n=1 Tax=Aureimonas ureilytica TaxID=401562 RepID=A0A175R8S5_9HYPH|nr:DUF4268 domain-containing protein [Aureimonas ureilytica]KTQ96013.1 membrane protein [Aureimonas ureilytica]
MFKIDREGNSISPMPMRSFADLGFRERAHLQEWIAKFPKALGEDLLIIQKEFSGFSDTNERLDLLALDKAGSLVIIENKLDDAGRDVTWQALKYASYCSSLTSENIRSIFQDYLQRHDPSANAEHLLCEFLGVDDFDEVILNKGVSQRIILVAAHFRKEVTSTVLWLANFGIRLQCFRVTPYSLGDDLFLDVGQVIPTPDAEEFRIGFAEKLREESGAVEAEVARGSLRREFWTALLAAIGERSTLFQNNGPAAQNWIAAGSGIRGVSYQIAVTRHEARVEIYLDSGDSEQNSRRLECLLESKEKVEAAYGSALEWDDMGDARACRVRAKIAGNVFMRETWPELISSLVEMMIRFEAAMRAPLAGLKNN